MVKKNLCYFCILLKRWSSICGLVVTWTFFFICHLLSQYLISFFLWHFYYFTHELPLNSIETTILRFINSSLINVLHVNGKTNIPLIFHTNTNPAVKMIRCSCSPDPTTNYKVFKPHTELIDLTFSYFDRRIIYYLDLRTKVIINKSRTFLWNRFWDLGWFWAGWQYWKPPISNLLLATFEDNFLCFYE